MEINWAKGFGEDSIKNTVNQLIDPQKFPDANKAAIAEATAAAKGKDGIKASSEAIDKIYQTMVIPNLASTVAADTAKKVAEQKALLPGEVDKARQLAPIHIGEQVQAEIQESAACERHGSGL